MSNYLKNIRTAPLKAIAARVLEILPKDSISIDKLEEWVYQAYTDIAPREIYEVRFAYSNITNHRGSLPESLYYLEMVLYRAYDNHTRTRTFPYTNQDVDFSTTTDVNTNVTTNTTTVTTVTTDVTTQNVKLSTGQDIEVYNQDENGTLTKEQIYFNDYIKSSGWKPLPLATNIFHASAPHGTPHDVYSNCSQAFSIQDGCIVTSFSEGEVLIAYTGIPTNSEGEFLYADYEYVAAALEAAVLKNYWKWKLNTGNSNGALQKYQLFAREYEILAVKATGELMMPDLIQYQTLRNVNKFIKEDSPFSTIMGALNNREKVYFNNPLRSSGYLYGLNIAGTLSYK